MDADLTQLEEKLARLLDEHSSVATENRDLRSRVAKLEADNKRLNDKLAEAARRVEAVLSSLPAESA